MALPKIITLCGSTRFRAEFDLVNMLLTFQGDLVISCGVWAGEPNSEIKLTKKEKELLDELHLRKIDLADEIYVINKDGYIGESTLREIKYARAHGKPIEYLEDNKPKRARDDG